VFDKVSLVSNYSRNEAGSPGVLVLVSGLLAMFKHRGQRSNGMRLMDTHEGCSFSTWVGNLE